MCEQCETGETELDKEQSPTQFQGEDNQTVTLVFEPIGIDTENLAEDVEFDNDEFRRGLKEASYLGGLYTGLLNAGFPLEDASNYIFAKMNADMNIKIAELNSQAQIQVSKNKSEVIDNQQL